jgi:hypothetical protein
MIPTIVGIYSSARFAGVEASAGLPSRDPALPTLSNDQRMTRS